MTQLCIETVSKIIYPGLCNKETIEEVVKKIPHTKNEKFILIFR